MRAICELRPKRKPWPLRMPRNAQPPRLPLSPEAPAWVLSSLLDIIIGVVLVICEMFIEFPFECLQLVLWCCFAVVLFIYLRRRCLRPLVQCVGRAL